MKIAKRIYEDYFKASRLPRYKETLQVAKELGYIMCGVAGFFALVQQPDGLLGKKVLINRHDIDTSPRVARRMFEIEKEVYGQEGQATYYFRKTTTDNVLIRDIDEYGYETGYHYEEIADYIKQRKLKDKDEILNSLADIRKAFLDNLARFREETGSPSLSVASHGDWVNRVWAIANLEILRDDETRVKSGIVVEAYDDCIIRHLKARFADQVLLADWADKVIDSMKSGTDVIMLLTHPRNWKVDCSANTEENIRRWLQTVKYKL